MTCPPKFIAQLINFPDAGKIVFENRILKYIPEEVMDRLMRVEYFAKAYDEDGCTRDEYNTHPALQKTAEQFSAATEEMVQFAADCIEDFRR